MEEQVIKAGSSLIEMGVVGAVALLTLAGCAWLVRYTFTQSAKREASLLDAIGKFPAALEKLNQNMDGQAQVLRDIHTEILRSRPPAAPGAG